MSKITPEARKRCAAHTLAEQLEQVRNSERMAEYRRRNGANDQADIETAFAGDDTSWAGQHARLTKRTGGAS